MISSIGLQQGETSWASLRKRRAAGIIKPGDPLPQNSTEMASYAQGSCANGSYGYPHGSYTYDYRDSIRETSGAGRHLNQRQGSGSLNGSSFRSPFFTRAGTMDSGFQTDNEMSVMHTTSNDNGTDVSAAQGPIMSSAIYVPGAKPRKGPAARSILSSSPVHGSGAALASASTTAHGSAGSAPPSAPSSAIGATSIAGVGATGLLLAPLAELPKKSSSEMREDEVLREHHNQIIEQSLDHVDAGVNISSFEVYDNEVAGKSGVYVQPVGSILGGSAVFPSSSDPDDSGRYSSRSRSRYGYDYAGSGRYGRTYANNQYSSVRNRSMSRSRYPASSSSRESMSSSPRRGPFDAHLETLRLYAESSCNSDGSEVRFLVKFLKKSLSH